MAERWKKVKSLIDEQRPEIQREIENCEEERAKIDLEGNH